jgi:mannose-6-phosphate isomerase
VRPAPFRILPTFHPRIWGKRSLAPIFPDKTGLSENIGEAWLTDERCVITNGPFASKTLAEAWPAIPGEWRGPRCAEMRDFPLLVKFIFPTDKLSIQVHPDDEYASVHETASGGRGKTEMWHVVSAEPGAQLLLGLRPGVTKKEFAAALGCKSLEDLLQVHPVEESNTFFVPAGVPHSIGPGVVVCEVQQYCDLTYRIYDYGRVDAQGKPRQLHIDKAMEVIRFGRERVDRVRPLEWASQKMGISLLAACQYFATERWRIGELFAARPKTDAFNLLVFLEGKGKMRWDGGIAPYHPGECWFMPASLKSYDLIPVDDETSLIRTFVPDLNALRGNLRMLGVADTKISDVVFE